MKTPKGTQQPSKIKQALAAKNLRAAPPPPAKVQQIQKAVQGKGAAGPSK
ncbi:MAG TPA: hypothetical protein VJN18_25125 [Polyangiaceae bacterium]|nr:hypothetical protein [Polyangiaceae bacterium]